ncbi:hypothetical protein [Undibacterium sp. TS12]|uniref:hypothetical protein n=1 Tax=Undibacterium sp. TS12 TaxID=2908202 RepID=UPI001F4C879D|nr:hypothetical protein [Undibacterium sp. TS12]MCH8619190.1 hypothetical protein [Undibacterium sp. TS12]
MTNIRKVLHSCLVLICLLSALVGSGFARAETALGMVLDVQGSGKVEFNGSSSKLQLLAYLQPKMQIILDAGSKASLSLYASRTVVQLTGPATVVVDKDGITTAQGQKITGRPLAEKLVRAAETSNVIAGAVRMRQLPPRIVAVTPENNALLLGQRPVFNWISAEGAEFEISLHDLDENLLVSEKTRENTWQLPEKIKLAEGSTYRWQVAYVSAKDGKMHTAKAEFRVADKAEAGSLLELKPDDHAGVEEWVMYAAMLQSRRAFAEARQVWQTIAKQRPDLLKLTETAQ